MPLPPGYTLDKPAKATPKLPPGYTLDSAPTEVATSASSVPTVTTPAPPAEGFLASLAAPFVDTAKALVPHSWKELAVRSVPGLAQYDALKRMVVEPAIGQGKQAVDEFKQAGAESPWYSFHPSPAAVSHRKLALGHGLAAALPMVGPWAAQVGQKEGEQLGTGNYSGAAGTAVGNALLALAPKAVGKMAEIAPQSIVRRLAGSGPGVARNLVREAAEDNRKIAIENAGKQANRTAAENTLDLRRLHEWEYQQTTDEHYAREAAADAQAKAEENAAWTGWRQKTAGRTLDGGQIVEPLQKLRLDSPEVDRMLNQLEPKGDEVPQESPYAQIRERAAQHQFGRDYESLSPVNQDAVDDLLHTHGYSPEPIRFDPQAGQPILIDRVQRASSILQRYIRSGRFEGPLLHEMGQVAKVLRNAVTRASAEAGAATDLAGARKATVTYQQAFGRERRPPTTARTLREQQANPEAFRERAIEERLARARNYDPTLVDSYRRVRAAREALKQFPTEDQLRRGLQQPTPTRKISAEDLRRANEAAVQHRGSSAVGSLIRLSVVWPAFHMLSDLMRGREISAGGVTAIPAAGATGMAIEEVLSHPGVKEFLIRPSRQQIAQIPPNLRGDIPEVVEAARTHGVPVSPLLAAYAAAVQKNRPKQQNQSQQSQPFTPAQAIQAMQPAGVPQ